MRHPRVVPILAVLLVAACGTTPTTPPPSRRPIVKPTVFGSVNPSASVGPMPAYLLNPNVTQDTIRTTICVSGWTSTVRPPAAYTIALKRRQIADRRLNPTSLAAYEEDHFMPLELGGDPTNPAGADGQPVLRAGNLWPEPIARAHVKDQDENSLKVAVCAGSMTLAAARGEIWATWGPDYRASAAQ